MITVPFCHFVSVTKEYPDGCAHSRACPREEKFLVNVGLWEENGVNTRRARRKRRAGQMGSWRTLDGGCGLREVSSPLILPSQVPALDEPL